MKITVVGAGFSGLITAYYLKKRGLDVEIVEKTKRVGGLISTIQTDYGLIETAANGIINTELVEKLFEDLGLNLTPTRKIARKRFIFREQPRQWPLSILESFVCLGKLLLSILMGYKRTLRPREGESISTWARRNFGKSFAAYLVEPALQGIYAGDPERLSATLILGRYFQASKPKVKLNYSGTVSARKGMGQLIESLANWLKENKVPIRVETEAVWNPNVKKWKWVIATNACEAAKILESHPVSTNLELIEYSPVVTITAFFHPLDARTKGFGILFPRDQGVRALGVLFNNEIFESRSDYRSETWIYGGALDYEVIDLSEPELMSQLFKDRKFVERGISKPLHYRIQRWPLAIPHYTLQLEKLLATLPEIENTYLVGNYLGGLGLAKIVESAHALAQNLEQESTAHFIVRKEVHSEERRAPY